MEANFSKQMKVGLFTLVGVITLMISILVLGGGQSFLRSTYTLKVKFDQVQGLNKGSIVTLSGFPVGNVAEIEFLDQENLLEVSLTIDKKHQKRITEGSVASVKTQGALGDKYIFIDTNQDSQAPIPDNGFLTTGESGDFLDRIAKKGDQLGEVMDVVREAHILLKNLNTDGNSGKLVHNLVESTASIKKLSDSGRLETLAKLNSVLDKIDKGEGTLGALINDPSIYRKLNGFLGETKREKFLSPLLE